MCDWFLGVWAHKSRNKNQCDAPLEELILKEAEDEAKQMFP